MSQQTSESVDFAPAHEPASSNGNKGSSSSIDARIAPRRRRWPWLVVGAAVGCGATAVALGTGDGADQSGSLVQETVQLSTVTVESRDLVEEVEWAGTLSAGLPVVVNSGSTGVITSAAEAGTQIGRGDVIAVIGDEPVATLFGAVPPWRDLREGDVGPDVLQLETNLVQLGFDPDGSVTVDDEYTSSTAEMVESWEESLGLEPSGRVPATRLAVLAGPSTVSEAAIVGSTAHTDGPLATLTTPAETIDVIGWQYDAGDEAPGAVTSIAAVGTRVEHGTVLYSIDGGDVVAVVELSAETDAVLTAFAAGDVEQIESVLVFIGFDPDSAITIDDELDLTTVAAVQRWQASVGLPTTGSSNPRDYVVLTEAADGAFAVVNHTVAVGDLLGEGRVVLGLAAPALSITADVAIAEVAEFSIGDPVRVVQLDDSEFTAVVSEIADVATTAGSGQNAEPTIAVTFEITGEPDRYISGGVTVVTESSRIDDAVVVPTRALVTLREGGFAVEVGDPDGTTCLVGVELGVFDDGWVEITNDSLTPGDEVIVPS